MAFLFTKEAELEDKMKKEQGESSNQRMARICQPAMCHVSEDLDFTVEVAEEFENERLPTLDFSLWLEEGQITHSYFQKPMKTPFVIMERSAMSYQQKMEILSNETARRLTNIDHERLGKKEIMEVLEQFTQELRNSEYKVEQARDILIS